MTETENEKPLPDLRKQLMLFRINERVMGLPVTRIREVLQTEEFTWVPRSNEMIRGAINHQGEIFVVADLERMLSGRSSAEGFVLLLQGSEQWGVRVGKICEVTHLDDESLAQSLLDAPPGSDALVDRTLTRPGQEAAAILNDERLMKKFFTLLEIR